jgi:hypothetical protein
MFYLVTATCFGLMTIFRRKYMVIYFCMLYAWLAFIILQLVVCILLLVLGQVQGFRLTQHCFEKFFSILYKNRYMFRSYDHLQVILNNYSKQCCVRRKPWTWLNLGCLHPVACVRSDDGGFYIPSTQRHYRRLIYYYIIFLHVSVVRPSSSRKYIRCSWVILVNNIFSTWWWSYDCNM